MLGHQGETTGAFLISPADPRVAVAQVPDGDVHECGI